MEPEPMMPKPPALLTAAASRQPEFQIMPACIKGKRTPKRDVTRLDKERGIQGLKAPRR